MAAIEKSFVRRFPEKTARGRPPVSPRVLLALGLLKHELSCADEQICQRVRTGFAVMYACGITDVQVDASQEYFVLPEVLATFRRRIDHPLMDELLSIQAAAVQEGRAPYGLTRRFAGDDQEHERAKTSPTCDRPL